VASRNQQELAIGIVNSESAFSGTTTTQRPPLLSRWHIIAALQIADFVAIAGSIILALVVFRHAAADNLVGNQILAVEALVVGVPLTLAFHLLGVYRYKVLGQAAYSSILVFVAWMVIAGPFLLLNMGSTAATMVAADTFLAWSITLVCLLIVIRLLVAQVNKELTRMGLLANTICVVGDGIEARSCIRQAHLDTSNNVLLGCFHADEGEAIASGLYVGHVRELPAFMRRQRVDEIIVATPVGGTQRLHELITELRCLPVTLSVWPETINLPTQMISTKGNRLGSIPLVPLGGAPLSGWAWVAKEIQDRSLAALLLLACSPVLLAISLAVRLSSPGPALFRQKREGYRGREFDILKFRTMHQAASQPADRLVLTTKGDSRIFPLGALLRRTSLDELPQLLNVLRGDMWLVGPRPHSRLATAADLRYADAVRHYAGRHKIKPGITGWAQINGWRGPTQTVEQIERRVAHDIYYIDNWSPLFDLKILLMTVVRGFVHHNAF
jgi:Undecaprenyl-phosphate glucose phosphotransferase